MIYDLRFKINFFVNLIVVPFLIVSTLFSNHYSLFHGVSAEPNCDAPAIGDIDYCMQKIQALIDALAPAQETNKKDLAKLRAQLDDLNRRIDAISAQLDQISVDIAQREEDLAFTQKIFEEKAASQYKFIRLYDPIVPFLTANDASQAFREINFRQKAIDEDRKTMDKYAGDLLQLKNDKDNLEKNKTALASAKAQIEPREKFLAGEVAKTEAVLASLTAKQQAFLAQKLSSLGISRSAYNLKGGCTDDRNVDPGFSPRIAFFTFGVPNRVGLNQFGARGRAEAGQNAQAILSAYYNADYTSGYNQGINIHVVGTNEFGQGFDDNWNIEDYLKHLYEMPTSWDSKALQAQAIAARSYALAYTNNGANPICPSQQCQVVKRELNDGAWQSAVDATRGIVLTNGGQPIKAWFSSTHGGYAFNSGDIGWNSTAWTKRVVDTTSGGAGSFSDLFNNAYDKNSPIFYCDWGARASYSKTAWLTPIDLADIVNAVLLVSKDGSTKSHLYQTDKPNPEGTDTWDSDTVKNKLSQYLTPFNSVSDVSVGVDFGSGRTTTVTVSGDAPSQQITGDDFKNYFNLRAPSNIQIVGPLFNVEKR